ncbi:glycosyltransferase [Salisediminibacterium beveridgei]|uniref:Glycosyl transferase, family 2 n=1 Tax=Salisediminibacterium beveridgei TaxID=632773 RepID=A0A1D7QUP6_9BACI|nr:glycosyltransferase family 2 protein [Salisediminibacterium beveridgei]AOM82727.1 Glycosyl transferase, family 2 [Salisediminibacterium beveridgei]
MIFLMIWTLLVIQVWVLFNGNLLSILKVTKSLPAKGKTDQPLISVMVPMRNEERHAEGCIQTLKGLDYDALQFIIIDDGSEDRTASLLDKAIDYDPRFTVIQGSELPENWVGKVHACYQLSTNAQGDYYLFLDADVRVHPSLIHETLEQMKPDVGIISGFPHYPLKGVLGHLLVPLQHVIVYLHLPVMFANFTTWPAATAAHGAFMFFRKKAYEDAGGHQAVKNSLVEDVHITRKIKASGWKGLLVNPSRLISCYMYESNREVWEGFSKNIYPGIGRNPFIAVMLSAFYLTFFTAPLGIAIYGAFLGNWLFIVPLLLVISIKITIDLMNKQKWWLGLFMPVSMLLLVILLIYSMYLSFAGKGFTWKGRTYS